MRLQKGCRLFRLSIMDARFLLILLVALIAPLAPRARSQEKGKDLTGIPLEDLAKLQVYSASKFLQKISEAPSSVSIISAEEIAQHGYRTLDDILRNTTGFSITNDRNYSYIGARGFGRTGDYNTRFLVLIDGHRMNEIIYDSLDTGTAFILDMDLVDRVEIVRGPGSALYGANAFFGVMNIITKSGHAWNGLKATVEAGSRNTYGGSAGYGTRFKNGLDILIFGSYQDSKGNRSLYYPEFDTAENNHGIAQDADGDRSGHFFASMNFKDLSAQLAASSRRKTIPTASFDTYFNDRRTYTLDANAYLDFKYQHSFGNEWDLVARSSFNAYKYDGLFPYNSSGDDSSVELVNNVDLNRAYWLAGEAQVTRSFGERHRLIAGADWRYSFRADAINYDDYPQYESYINIREYPYNSGFFLQGDVGLHEKLILNAGFRYDRYSSFGGTANPRFALIYSPWDKMNFKLLHGYAFRAPNLYERLYQDYQSMANPALKPERIQTTEILVERFWGRHFRVTGSAYKNKITKLIDWQTNAETNLNMFVNSGKDNSNGIELELEAKNWRGIDGRIGYAVQRTVSADTLEEMVNSPRHIAQMSLSLPIQTARCWSGLDMHYISSRKTLNDGVAGGYFLADITLLYRNLLPHIDLKAGIYNVFDRHYADVAGEEHRQAVIPQDGRSFRISLTYQFASSSSDF
jgi:outer membrane receptor for ferrienterochelin and colicins